MFEAQAGLKPAIAESVGMGALTPKPATFGSQNNLAFGGNVRRRMVFSLGTFNKSVRTSLGRVMREASDLQALLGCYSSVPSAEE